MFNKMCTSDYSKDKNGIGGRFNKFEWNMKNEMKYEEIIHAFQRIPFHS